MAGTHGITETLGTEISQLVASEVHEQKIVTIVSGQNLVRGAVMESSNQKYTGISTPGSAEAILAEDVDASLADKQGMAYFTGKYRYSDLVWPTMSAANKKTALEALQARGIIVDADLTTVEETA
ncbi:MAG: head decoration protein [Candidatus Marinimicrobia bacterium]|nr:head decoration protein [Candidatus Neomarinimicrobiota bacterium]